MGLQIGLKSQKRINTKESPIVQENVVVSLFFILGDFLLFLPHENRVFNLKGKSVSVRSFLRRRRISANIVSSSIDGSLMVSSSSNNEVTIFIQKFLQVQWFLILNQPIIRVSAPIGFDLGFFVVEIDNISHVGFGKNDILCITGWVKRYEKGTLLILYSVKSKTETRFVSSLNLTCLYS